jgi:hypothetical protein
MLKYKHKPTLKTMIMNKQIIKAIPVKKNGKNGQSFLGPVDNLGMRLIYSPQFSMRLRITPYSTSHVVRADTPSS